jgi:aspartate racemase
MQNKMIGILAGMGPRSTAPFIDLVVDECQRQYGAKYDLDFPRMLILSQPTPFYLDRPIDHIALKSSILAGLKELARAGVSFIAMPCNTAHVYFDELQAELQIPVLNMITATLARLPQKARVTLFATQPTFDAEVYQQGLKREGGEFVFVPSWQPSITGIIALLKAGQLEQALEAWRVLVSQVQDQGQVQAIILACTDLQVVARQDDAGVILVDSARALAEATVQRYLQEQERSK